MDFLAELLVSALIVIGGIFGLVGSYGLVKLPDLLTRLHSPTKSRSLGIGGVLLASMIYGGWQNGCLSFHELLITPVIKSDKRRGGKECVSSVNSGGPRILKKNKNVRYSVLYIQ